MTYKLLIIVLLFTLTNCQINNYSFELNCAGEPNCKSYSIRYSGKKVISKNDKEIILTKTQIKELNSKLGLINWNKSYDQHGDGSKFYIFTNTTKKEKAEKVIYSGFYPKNVKEIIKLLETQIIDYE